MTADTLPLAELMQKVGGDDFLRAVAEAALLDSVDGPSLKSNPGVATRVSAGL